MKLIPVQKFFSATKMNWYPTEWTQTASNIILLFTTFAFCAKTVVVTSVVANQTQNIQKFVVSIDNICV